MTDSAGPYVGVIKALFALESGIIVQNINMNEVNNRIGAFAENKLQVVVKPTSLTSDKILVNSVGITGSLSQVVLRRNTRSQKLKESSFDQLPRLIFACTRTADSVENILKTLKETKFDEEFISMTNDVFAKDMPFHIHRGYTILASGPNYEKKHSIAVGSHSGDPFTIHVNEDSPYYYLKVDNFYDIEKYISESLFFLAVVPADEAIPSKVGSNFLQITEQQFANEKFHLLKKKSLFDKKNIKIETDDWSATCNPKTKESEVMFFVKQNINSDDLSFMFAESRHPSDSRYLFVMDDEIRCQTALKNQQNQDLPVSVLQNGEWGSYQYLSESSPTSKQNTNNSDHLPGDIQLESICLQYLCCDKEVELHDRIYNYGIEYSGVQDTGERVMGLSLIDFNDPISKPDSILKWKVPQDWTLEDAATVPFIYAQAYHILDAPVILDKKQLDSVLINIGDEGLFCEACIAISLSRNYIVYVSVASAEEAASIKNKFPQ
ncbi:fatty-acid synthase system, partial [Sarracenia purpurea var. burkii]